MKPLPPLAVAEGYDRWAPTYDGAPNVTRDASDAHLRRQAFDLDGADVLDLGCGTGANARWLAERGAQVTALDFSPGMLELARANTAAHNLRLLRHDIRQPLPVADGSTDLVVAYLVLEHIGDLTGLFGEVCRVLRPGGRILLCELHPYRQLMGKQARFLDIQLDAERLIEAWPHSIAEFANTAVGAGLTIVRLEEDAPDAAGFPRLFSLIAQRPA